MSTYEILTVISCVTSTITMVMVAVARIATPETRDGDRPRCDPVGVSRPGIDGAQLVRLDTCLRSLVRARGNPWPVTQTGP